MKAVIINDITPGEKISFTEIPIPKVKPGWVLIRNKRILHKTSYNTWN